MTLNKNIIFYFIIYVVTINIIAFLSMYIDKQLSKKHKRRISEKTLFSLALLLGSCGSIIGMYKFRHKTKHTSFVIGMPVILVFNIICVYLLYKYGLFN